MRNVLIIGLFLLPLFAWAQAEDQTLSKQEAKVFDFGIAIVPQYAFGSTMRVDFDMTLNEQNTLTISPLFSFARNSSLMFSGGDSYDYNYYYEDTQYPEDISLTGGGLKLMWRHFFGLFNQNTGIYMGAGTHYRYSSVTYSLQDWETYIEDGLEYQVLRDLEKRDHFNQMGVDFILGYQLYLTDHIYGDVYAGWGFRISDFDEDESDDFWSETIFDPAYTGYTPLLGLRMGVFF